MLSSAARKELEDRVCGPVVSSPELCRAMHDKVEAEALFRSHQIPTPFGKQFPRLASLRFGASSRGHFVFCDEEEFAFFLRGVHNTA